MEWDGEMLFYYSDMDAEAVFISRPRRQVVFDGAIAHADWLPHLNCCRRGTR